MPGDPQTLELVLAIVLELSLADTHLAAMTTLEEARMRVARSTKSSFGFLIEDLGYTACGAELVGQDDPRDPYVLVAFFRGTRRVEVWLYALTLLPTVLIKDFSEDVGCEVNARHVHMIDLEAELPATAHEVERPPWLKKPTLHAQAIASHARFAALMSRHLEEAIEYLAQLLRRSGLAEVESRR